MQRTEKNLLTLQPLPRLRGSQSSVSPLAPAAPHTGALTLLLPTLLTLVLIVFSPQRATADYIAPNQTTLKTTAYRPDRVVVSPSSSEYVIKWQGLPVAKAVIESELNQAQNRARVTITAQTTNAIDLLYTLRHQSNAEFALDQFRPIRYAFSQQENSRDRGRQVEFAPNGEVRSTTYKAGVVDERISFTPNNLTLDPITGAFLARSLPLEVGKTVDLDIFNGKHRFLITFHVTAREDVKMKDRTVNTFRVEPSIKRLTDSKPEERLQSATLWISADENREIVKMESKVWIGRVTASLMRSGTPEGASPNLQRAQLAPPDRTAVR